MLRRSAERGRNRRLGDIAALFIKLDFSVRRGRRQYCSTRAASGEISAPFSKSFQSFVFLPGIEIWARPRFYFDAGIIGQKCGGLVELGDCVSVFVLLQKHIAERDTCAAGSSGLISELFAKCRGRPRRSSAAASRIMPR